MTRLLLAFVASLFFASIAAAASLEIRGAPGRSGASDQIDVLSFHWGATPAAGVTKTGPGTLTLSVGPAAQAGDVDGRDFLIWQRSTSPIASMILKSIEKGKTVKYKLSRCFVKSWSTSGDAGGPAGGSGIISYESMTVVR